ncbi:MAG TPA: PKD domain-containing protein [Bacteroidia bacterium]|nr:PKD domain-containing protein [Bacteroidia bacterium]
MRNMTLYAKQLFSLLFFVPVLLNAQQGSTPVNGQNPVSPSNVRIGDPATPQDGSTVLGPTFQMSECGLNYTTASQKIGQRISPAGVPQPATFAIAGIPATAVIQKAYVWCDASGNGAAINLNVTNPFTVATAFPMTLIGSDQDKCWGYSGTHSYRADVTACIAGNGNYTISGFPTSVSSGGTNDVDGATMMVIWSDPTSTFQGDIVIWDGCVVINGGTTTQDINNYTACNGTISNARAFMAIADLQGMGAQLVMNGSAPFTVVEDWWNYVDQPTVISPSQSLSNFNISSSGDCYNFCLMGVYFQSTCQTCCIAPYTLTMAQTPSSCSASNGTATATPNGGTGPFTYVWNTSPVQTGQTATGLPPGQYIVTVTDGTGCTTVDTVIVLGTGALPFSTSQVNVLCNGGNNGSATFTPTGGTGPFTYVWTPNVSATGSATLLTAGTYVVDVTDDYGCQNSFTFTITEPPLIPISANPSAPPSICIGGTITLSMTPTGGAPPYSYNWLNGPGNTNTLTVSPTTTTTYSCVVADACGNQADTGIVTVTVNPLPTISFSADDTSGCSPLCVTLTPLSNPAMASVVWSFGDGDTAYNAPTNHCYYASATYNVSLTVTDINGCVSTVTRTNYITVYPFPVAGFAILTPAPFTIQEATLGFDDQSTGGDTCFWDFGDGNGLQMIVNCGDVANTYDDTGSYHITQIVVNQYGCADTVETDIYIAPNTTLYVPNTFTPNGDGKNDFFFAYGEYVEDFHMMVFDRWGNLIFESYDMLKGWDGKANGGSQVAQIDTYVWKITFTERYNGHYHGLIGHVNLIR